jgi:hypothetical protein
MPVSIGVDPVEQARDRRFPAGGELGLGLVLSWSAVVASYYIEAIRSHYIEMTSFAPLGFIFILLLSPVWLGLRFVLRRHLPGRIRSPLAFLIPTVMIVFLSLRAILAVNQMWMSGPDY